MFAACRKGNVFFNTMILRRQNPVLENMYSGRYQINKKIYICIEYRILEAVCVRFCCLPRIYPVFFFFLAFCLVQEKPSQVFCLFSLPFLHHIAQAGILLSLCYISDLFARSVLSGPSSRSAVCFMLSLCYLCAISVLSLCYLCSLTLGVLFASCYRCAISVLSMVFHAGGCFLLCAISVLSLCYLCYLCAIDGLSCLEVSLALCYLCAMSVLSMVFHAGECFLLCAISVLSPCYFS